METGGLFLSNIYNKRSVFKTICHVKGDFENPAKMMSRGDGADQGLTALTEGENQDHLKY